MTHLTPSEKKLLETHQAVWKRAREIAEDIADLDLDMTIKALTWAMLLATNEAANREIKAKALALHLDIDKLPIETASTRKVNMKGLKLVFTTQLENRFVENELLSTIALVDSLGDKDA